MPREALPTALATHLMAEFPDETARLVVSADITRAGRYGAEWLVVTERSVLVFSAQDDGYVVRFNEPLARIEKVECAPLVGSAALRAHIDGRLHHVVSYTHAREAEFGQAADDINHFIQGTPPTPVDPSRRRRLCQNAAVPFRATSTSAPSVPTGARR